MKKNSHSDSDVTIGQIEGDRPIAARTTRIRTSTDVALQALGGRWKLAIVALLGGFPRRTGELRKAIPTISQRMLIAQLRELERDGLVRRTSYNEVPPRVVYRLTRYGRTALPIVRRLSGWGRRHAERMCAQQGSELRVVKVACGPRPNESTTAAV